MQQALEPDRSDVDRQDEPQRELQSHVGESAREHLDTAARCTWLWAADADKLQEWNQQEQPDAFRRAQDERDEHRLGRMAG